MISTIADFEYYVIKTETCWLWRGGLTNGHGSVRFKGINRKAHRVARHLYCGFDLESKVQVNHKTICPNAHCVNPDHTYEGTQTDNMNDLIDTRTHCINGHEFNKENTRHYNGPYGRYQRICRKCARINKKRHAEKKLNGHN